MGGIVKAILDFIWGILRADKTAKTATRSSTRTRDWVRERLRKHRDKGSDTDTNNG